MAVGDIILTSDYNNIQTIVQRVLGTGSSNKGYGQPVLSSQKSDGDVVSIQEWDNVRNDIINIYRHQNGTIPTIPSAVEGAKIRFNSTNSVWNKFYTEIQSLETTRFNIGAGQFTTTTYPTKSRTGGWSVKSSMTIVLEWSSAEKARHYFNSGGKINFLSERTGGTTGTDPNTIGPQNQSWSDLLDTAGTVSFGGNTPGTGVNPNDGTNYFRLSSTFQPAYSISASTPYGDNEYRISARCNVADNSNGTADTVTFFIEWIDAHEEQGGEGYNDEQDFGPDNVDGTLTLYTDSVNPLFNLVPASNSPVTIEEPTVVVGNISAT